ncbi:MAG: tetratricopeptide repeat protein [Clostridia bacterium]|nr:tetratricopeptide repeat protein [Clostridia bacterium]
MERIPTGRIIEKLEAYYAKNDVESALSHLLYWLGEAKALGDRLGEYQMHNELMGHYRKNGKKEEAIEHAKAALDLLEPLGISDSVSGGIARINAATVYKAFGMPEESIALFWEAERILTRFLPPDDPRLGGLYNNMGLTLCDLSRLEEAKNCYTRALEIMQKQATGKPEVAITYLNLANLVEKKDGLEAGEEEISALLDLAWENLMVKENTRDGYFAFVCEKCAPTFGYYGRFFDEAELKRIAGEIYGKGT